MWFLTKLPASRRSRVTRFITGAMKKGRSAKQEGTSVTTSPARIKSNAVVPSSSVAATLEDEAIETSGAAEKVKSSSVVPVMPPKKNEAEEKVDEDSSVTAGEAGAGVAAMELDKNESAGAPVCSECEAAAAVKICEECDGDVFCNPCFEVFHTARVSKRSQRMAKHVPRLL